MPIGAPNSLTNIRRFFAEPQHVKQRQYEALRAYFYEERDSAEVARSFGYSVGSFRVLCHQFRRERDPQFFLTTRPGPRQQPKKTAARELAVSLRKQNHSVYEISEALKEKGLKLSPTAVLREEGFAALPRRLDEERSDAVRPTIEAIANALEISISELMEGIG